ncbi:MAG: hypothetical protein GY866_19645 [Proteobacteria bacterium]|nr:hypothetical protein [Pseudomonadota bacterium]
MTRKKHCDECGKLLPPYGSVNVGSIEKGYRHICTACYNAEIVEYAGVDFEHADFEPIKLSDVDGAEHEFHFNIRLLGDRVALDAYETKNDGPRGYQFQVIGFDPEGEPLALFGQLLEKMRRELARKHLERETDGTTRIAGPGIVRARIDCDLDHDDETRTPLLVIDGKEIRWSDFGSMLMCHEGFNFKMEIYDKSEER